MYCHWPPNHPLRAVSTRTMPSCDSLFPADRLQRRGCPNCGICKLSNQVQESGVHLFTQCRFTKRIWTFLKTWLGLHDLNPDEWDGFDNLEDWWTVVMHKRGGERKSLSSLAMLVSWEIWLERNALVFRNKSSTANMLFDKIKEEAVMWCHAEVKALCNIMPRE